MTASPLIAATTKQPSLLPSLNWHDNDRLMIGEAITKRVILRQSTYISQ